MNEGRIRLVHCIQGPGQPGLHAIANRTARGVYIISVSDKQLPDNRRLESAAVVATGHDHVECLPPASQTIGVTDTNQRSMVPNT